MTDLSLARHIGAVLAQAGADIDPAETAEWCEALDALIARPRRRRARASCSTRCSPRAPRAACALPPVLHAVRQHHPARGAAAVPRQPGDGAAHRRDRALERAGDGGARQPRQRLGRARRPHRHLRLDRRPVRGRLQPFLSRPRGRASRRPGLLPAARGARRLCARLPRRPARADDLAHYRQELDRAGAAARAACRRTRIRS